MVGSYGWLSLAIIRGDMNKVIPTPFDCPFFCGCCSECLLTHCKHVDHDDLDLRMYLDGSMTECNVYNPPNHNHKCKYYSGEMVDSL